MEIKIESLPYLLGTLQALVLLIGINIRRPLKTVKQKTMSYVLLSMSIILFYYTVVVNEYYGIWPYIDSLGTAAWMSLSPLYYLFCKSVSEPNWKLTWRVLPFFTIPLIFCTEGLLTTLGIPAWLYLLVGDAQIYLDLWMGAFFTIGIFFALKSVQLHRGKRSETSVNKTLSIFSYTLSIAFVGYAVTYLFVREDYPIWFELSLVIWSEIFIFVLVYKVFTFQSLGRLLDTTKYGNESMDANKRKLLAAQLEQRMHSERPFLDRKLNLSKLSDAVDLSTNTLSQLFTAHYKSNFYTFVNDYRLSHLETLLENPQFRNYTILALAEESGFSSKATFYKAFRNKHNCAPSEYIKQKIGTR